MSHPWIRDVLNSSMKYLVPLFTTMRWRLVVSAVAIATLIGYASLIYIPQYSQSLAYAAADEKAQNVDKGLVNANTRFAFDILKELSEEDNGKNIFISPFSISMALAMAYNGAEGSTKDAMANTLQFGGMNLGKVNQGYLDLMGSLENADSQLSLNIGNSVWVDKGFGPKVNQTFTNRLSTYFEGEMFTRQIEDPRTVEDINNWVSDETNKKIDKIVERIDPDMVMFLLNAIYFKGDWTKKFDESKTYRGDFFLPDRSAVEVDLMSTLEDFSHYSGKDFEAVRLPYGRDKVAMYVFLPREGVSLDYFIDNLNQVDFDDYISNFSSPSKIRVDLPKFKLEYGTKRLNAALKNLGMSMAFDRGAANFDGIAKVDPENLYLSFVDHKAVIEVNEKGTEAAAVTNVGIAVTSMPSYETLIVNRPFFFVIRDDRSGSILFMGKIVDPTQLVSP